MHTAISKELFDQLVALMRAYGANKSLQPDCPACGSAKLTIEDRSTPPVALWYDAGCPHCGLTQTVHIPLGAGAFVTA
jgi:hypothetical protein